MNLNGLNFLGRTRTGNGNVIFRAVNPATGDNLAPDYFEATIDEINEAVLKANEAFQKYRIKSGQEKAILLETIAEEITALGDDLIKRCCNETGLPEARIIGELGRTIKQLNLFAQLLRESSWVDARIDTAIPARQPIPKPDIRSLQKPLGAVGIFGASNFPLAFSVAGGDTVSALAAGCTVVVKAHPAHPGTCEMIAAAFQKAIEKSDLPDGIFSMVQGSSVEVGMAIVKHPLIKAIGFTGSFKGGKAIFDAAVRREEPIPVYAEMGSTNPVFILPNTLQKNGETIAKGLAGSVTLGVGQFCTNPGIVVIQNSDDSQIFQRQLAKNIQDVDAGVMLTSEIQEAYGSGIATLAEQSGVELITSGANKNEPNHAAAHLLKTSAAYFLSNGLLQEEVFGPSTLAVEANSREELLKIAQNLSGHLTATIFGTEEDFKNFGELISILEQKVGRLIINGFPTGVEVCDSMVHGGPFPATTDCRTTSVGTAAITRFTRPVCYQNFPDSLLPDELKNNNPLGVRRIINGKAEQ
ncbi:MAG: aldehyde dehydrogenase (NADP(+)) [Acidobacteriota bacterium]